MARKKGSKDSKPRRKRGEATEQQNDAGGGAPASAAPRAQAGDRGIGDNSGLTDDQRRALLIHGIVKVERLKDQIASITGSLRNEFKKLKADGFEKYEVDFALQLRKSEDKVEQEKWRKMLRVAVFLNHPIGSQSDLLDGIDRTPAVDRSYQEGKLAGLEAKGPLSPPSNYTPGTEQYDGFCRGWHDGQTELVKAGIVKSEGIGPTLIKANRPGAAATTSNDPAGGFDDALADAGVNAADFGSVSLEHGGGNGSVAKKAGHAFAAEGDAFIQEQIDRKKVEGETA